MAEWAKLEDLLNCENLRPWMRPRLDLPLTTHTIHAALDGGKL